MTGTNIRQQMLKATTKQQSTINNQSTKTAGANNAAGVSSGADETKLFNQAVTLLRRGNMKGLKILKSLGIEPNVNKNVVTFEYKGKTYKITMLIAASSTSKTTIANSGLKATFQAGATASTTIKTGTQVNLPNIKTVKNPDGSTTTTKVETDKDGNKTTTVTNKDKNGKTTSVTTETVDASGKKVKETKKRYGDFLEREDTTMYKEDGSKETISISYNADGTHSSEYTETINEDGSRESRKTSKTYYGHYIETSKTDVNGNRETIATSYDKNGKAMSSTTNKTITNADGSKIQNSIRITYNEDGSKSENINNTIESTYKEPNYTKVTISEVISNSYDADNNLISSSKHIRTTTKTGGKEELVEQYYKNENLVSETTTKKWREYYPDNTYTEFEEVYDQFGLYRETTTTYNADKSKTIVKKEYDKEGNTITDLITTVDKDGNKTKMGFEYIYCIAIPVTGDITRIDAFRRYDDEGNLVEEKSTSYDRDGNIVNVQTKTIEINADGSKRITEVTYDNDGNCLTTTTDENGNVTKLGVETDISYSMNGTKTSMTKTTYNEDGSIVIEKTTYNEDGSVKSETVTKYDKDGNKI